MSPLRRRVIVCQEWTELITDYLEGVLPRRMVRAIDRHLAGCPHCAEYLAQMRRTIAVAGALPLDADVPAELLDVLQAAFEDASRSPRDGDADGPGDP